MSQPPLSKAIRRLEDDLGVQLFQRTSRAVTSTESGRVFAEAARGVVTSFDCAVAETRRTGGAVTVLRIGCSPYLPLDMLQQFVAALHVRDPHLPTQTTHVFAVEQMRMLHAGELDLGIFPAAHNDVDLEMEFLFAGEPLALLLPIGHRLAAKQVLGPDDVSEEALLIVPRAPNPAFHDGLRAHIENAGYRFRCVVETRAMTVREMLFGVAEGRGVAFAPQLEGTDTIVVRRALDPPLSMPDTLVAWRKDAPSELQPTLDAVREVVRELRQRSSRSSPNLAA